ncbi:hypothetical protein LshimejAT787_0804120 [Lyophyllum shimeji]|uniref:Uncharacterized protein n=1 Tax=Lyophyllum shimeji TaxID=47721 RepID=A0A9P3URV4_LYOSH|nr:hypothetical protein LshimejAT787_0804120 [Lyophyllum shimeji]
MASKLTDASIIYGLHVPKEYVDEGNTHLNPGQHGMLGWSLVQPPVDRAPFSTKPYTLAKGDDSQPRAWHCCGAAFTATTAERRRTAEVMVKRIVYEAYISGPDEGGHHAKKATILTQRAPRLCSVPCFLTAAANVSTFAHSNQIDVYTYPEVPFDRPLLTDQGWANPRPDSCQALPKSILESARPEAVVVHQGELSIWTPGSHFLRLKRLSALARPSFHRQGRGHAGSRAWLVDMFLNIGGVAMCIRQVFNVKISSSRGEATLVAGITS